MAAGLHPLVGVEAAAVAQALVALGRIAERAHPDAVVVPLGGHVGSVRREHGDLVAGAHQRAGEVADERPRGVAGEPRVGLGQEE